MTLGKKKRTIFILQAITSIVSMNSNIDIETQKCYHVGHEEPRCWGRGSLHCQKLKSVVYWSGDISWQTLLPSVCLWVLIHKMTMLNVLQQLFTHSNFQLFSLNTPSQPGWGLGFSSVPGLAAKGIPLKTSTERKRPRGIFCPWTLPPSVCTTPS